MEPETPDLQSAIEKQYAIDAFKTLDYLLYLPQFIWYIDNVIKPLVNEELANAIDITRESHARDTAAQRHDFGQAILAAAAQKRIFWANKGDIEL